MIYYRTKLQTGDFKDSKLKIFSFKILRSLINPIQNYSKQITKEYKIKKVKLKSNRNRQSFKKQKIEINLKSNIKLLKKTMN